MPPRAAPAGHSAGQGEAACGRGGVRLPDRVAGRRGRPHPAFGVQPMARARFRPRLAARPRRRAPYCARRRKAAGGTPKAARNIRVRCAWSEKPQSAATALIGSAERASSACARPSRRAFT